MPQTINADASPALDFSMVVPSLGEAGKSAENAAAHKQHLDNAKALENAVATKASSADVTTLNNRLENGGDIDGRVDTLETAKIADEARLAVLEAQGVNNPLRRFQWSVSGEYPTPNFTGGIVGGQGIPLGSIVVTLPIGKILKLKNVRYGHAAYIGGVPTSQFQILNGSPSGTNFFSTGNEAEESPNLQIATNVGGSASISVQLVCIFASGATGTAITRAEALALWADLSIE